MIENNMKRASTGGDKETAEWTKGKYGENMQRERQRDARLLHSSTFVWSTREKRGGEKKKELGY